MTANRRRPKISKKKTNKDDNDGTKQEPAGGADNNKGEEEESLFQTFTSHWLVRYVFPIYLSFIFWMRRKPEFALQHPSSVNRWPLPFLPKLRESVVGHEDERQVLIVGTMSSGTRQITETLGDVIGLELGHEESDALSFYARDGTVSWIFGIRFLDAPPSNDIIIELCQAASFKVGFHPRMYRGGICSEQEQWSDCWERECIDILRTEWGCARKKKGGDATTSNNNTGCSSFQPHRRTLFQTRDPMKVVESLVAKFCVDDKNREDFQRISALLFFRKYDGGKKRGGSFFDDPSLTCLETAAYHVIEYNRAMLGALKSGLIDGTYRIEDATPCAVAELAGLGDDLGAVVYPPNLVKFYQTCRSSSLPPDAPGNQKIKAKRKNKTNRGRVSYTWSDLEGGKHGSKRPPGDMSLVNAIKDLAKDLGYQYDS